MEFLVTWLQALISLVLLLTLAELILPEGPMRPYVRVILGVVLVVAVLRPVVELGAFDWRLPALTLAPAAPEGPMAEGERLAGVLLDRARRQAEEQAALQASRLLEVRLGLRPEAVTVRLTAEGWVEEVEVTLPGRVSGGSPAVREGHTAPSGILGVASEVDPVQPVTVAPVRVGEDRVGGGGARRPPEDSGLPAAGDEMRRQVRALLADFYQVPMERVQVEP